VLPKGLVERGSLGSVEFTAAELYPASGSPIELVSPRAGSPALLGPGEEELTAVVWLADTREASALELTARSPEGESWSLEPGAQPDCDGLGLCRLRVWLRPELPSGAPDGSLLGLCVEGPSGARCQPGALLRFAELPVPLRVAQLTDLHLLRGDPGGERERRLAYLLGHLGTQRPPIHLVAVTGDLADVPGPDLARRTAALLGASPLPVIALPGNHDFKGGGIVHYLEAITPELDHAHRIGPYLLLALSSGPGRWEEERRGWNGESAGLEAGQISWIEEQLGGEAVGAGPPSASLILVHHPPYSALGMLIGRNRKGLLRAARAGGVSAILAGHTHRQEVFDREGVSQGLNVNREDEVAPRRRPVTLVGSPALDRLEGGVRLVELYPDGRLGYRFVSLGWP
jgi:predicted MPP superfamily phosphohydrolase